MTRRAFVAATGMAMGATVLPATGAADPQQEKPRPINLLLIMTDQQRWDALSCAGNPLLRTATLDRLAAEGVRFELCNSHCPVCAPDRSWMLPTEPHYSMYPPGQMPVPPSITDPMRNTIPNFMVRTRTRKFIYCRNTDHGITDCLFDLEADPHELHNLIGRHPDKQQHRAVAETMKGHLLDYLDRVKHPHRDEVARKPTLV